MIFSKSSCKMDVEVQVAVQFILSHMTEKFTQGEINRFSVNLRNLLLEKFEGHWYPEKPTKGSAYRCVSVDNQLDSLLIGAVTMSNISSEDLSASLPGKLDLWVDPTEVSYRIGEHGHVNMIYKEGDDCVNSTSEYLAKVLKQLPTVTPSKTFPGKSPNATKLYNNHVPVSHCNTPLMNLQQAANSLSGRRDNHLSASAKSFVSRNNFLNLPFLNNRNFAQAINPLLNLNYLQKLQQWPLMQAAGRYDPLSVQLVQNYLIMQELQRFETRRMNLQTQYLKIQNMRWPKRQNYGSNRQQHNHGGSGGGNNGPNVQISA